MGSNSGTWLYFDSKDVWDRLYKESARWLGIRNRCWMMLMMDIVLFVMMHFSGAADESVSVEDYTKKD